MPTDRHDAQHLSEELLRELDYRILMRVTEVQCFRLSGELTTFPVCPKCDSTFEREYQRFCDRCGQRLDWRDFERAIVILPQALEWPPCE